MLPSVFLFAHAVWHLLMRHQSSNIAFKAIITWNTHKRPNRKNGKLLFTPEGNFPIFNLKKKFLGKVFLRCIA